jgi:hypothetical protein
MKKGVLLIVAVFMISLLSFGQLTGTKTVPGDYPSVAAAISALNSLGTGPGGVVFNVASGYTETFAGATAGLIITTTGSASNPIVFQKSGAGANPVITGFIPAAGTTDYVFCIAGTDFITFDGINVTESTGAIEWGFSILKNSATDGSQNVTIRNCSITLAKTNTSTVGIYSANVTTAAPTTQLIVTTVNGANSNNKFYNNTIANCYNGIMVYGFNDPVSPYYYYDQNLEIGKDGANIISNFGGSTFANNGIYTIYQNGQRIANNNITGPSAGSGACAGILLATANNSDLDLYNNTVSIAYNGTGTFYGIYDNRGNTYTGATKTNNYNNMVTNCTYATAGSGTCYYMYFNGGAATCDVYGNTVTNNTYGSSSTTSTGTIYGIYFNGCQNKTGTVLFYNNQVTSNLRVQSVLGGGTNYYFYLNGGGTQSNFYNNTVNNNTAASTGTCAGMYALNNPSGIKKIYGNTITNILNSYGTMYGIYAGNSGGTYIFNNKIQNLNSLGTATTVYGINLSSVTNGDMYCYNNVIGDIKTPATSSANAIYGIYGSASGSNNLGIYNNTVYINASSTGVNFGTSGLYLGTSPQNIEVKNNIIVNTSVAAGTGYTTALRLASTSLLNYSTTSNNNNFYAGTPGPVNFIFYDGTNADPYLAAFKSRVIPRESQSMTENPPFLNIATTPMDLHINAATPTQVESSGLTVAIPDINVDFDNNPRYPNTGYPVNASYPPIAPDLGADEFGGIPMDLTAPFINYQPMLNTSMLTARTLVATITDMHGVPTSGIGLPRLAWKKLYNGTWTYVTGTSLGGNQYSFSFGNGVVQGDTVYYYVLAQDNWSTPNTGMFPIYGSGGYSANPPAATTPPATPYKYAIIQGICGTFNVGVGQTYPTLTAAIADISNRDLTCPVTLLLTDNDYSLETYPIIINQIAGASAVNTLTIKPAPGKTPAFITSYLGISPNPWSQISLNGAQWVIIDGSNSGGNDRSLTFQNGAGGGFAAAIGLYNNGTIGASNIKIKNCTIMAHTDALYNAQGIVLYNIAGNAGYNNVVIDNNAILAAKFGVQIFGIATNKATNCQVINNTIGSMVSGSAVVQYGVSASFTDNLLVQGNEIIGSAQGHSVGGACSGISISTGSTNTIISKNFIHDWWQTATAFPAGGSTGILYSAEASSVTEISNNVIYNIKSPGQSLAVTGANAVGMYISSGGNILLHHNSIYMGGAYMSSTVNGLSSCLTIGNSISNMDIRNNIFKNSSQPVSGTPGSKTYAVNVGTNPSNLTLNYNDYFVDGIGPNIGIYGATDRVTLADWQTATSQDANTNNIDPVFTSGTNLKPTTTFLNHSGTYIATVPTDILNINRTNPPDAGAYEYSSNPAVVTLAANALLFNGATLNGTINAAGTLVNSFFDYGLTTAYGTSVAGLPGSVIGTTTTPVNLPVSGLTPVTTYHFRARGVTSSGLVIFGNDMTFTTLNPPPAVITIAATSITGSGATLNGTVNANGAATTVTFEYGLTSAYGSVLSGVPANVTGSIVTNVLAAVTGLLPNTLYHYRVVGVSTGGTSYGMDLTFTTSPVLANVVTNLASGVTVNAATLNGLVTANYAATTVTFQYGLTTSYGSTANATPSTVNGVTATNVSAAISGLTTNTLYHFRCVGVNAAGTAYGLDQTFTTNCIAPVVSIAGPATSCVQSTGNVYTTQTGNSNYQWTISSGGVITAGAGTSSITVTWNTVGAQTVGVNYQNSFGCSAATPASFAVTVNPIPVPTIAGPATVCNSSTGNVYTTQAGNSNYAWTVSAGGTVTAGAGTNAITVNWTTSGAKTVSVNYTNASACAAPAPTVFNVTVNALPVPTITGQNSICANSGYIQYSTEAAMTAYAWTVSAGGTINSGQGTNTINVTWTSTGAQTVGVNYSNASGCSALSPASLPVTVNGLPGAAGSITGTATICGGAQGIAYSCAPIAGAGYYVWNLPAGATIATGAGTTNITVDYAANATSGNITVLGNNLCGNGTASPNFPVTVNALPAAAGAITGTASVCEGSNGITYTVASIANASSYSWTVPAGATIVSGGTTNTITVNFGTSAVSGNITVLGSNSCGNGIVSPAFAVTVNAVPIAPVVTATGITLSSSASAGNQWYYSATQGGTGNIIAGATSPTYTATQSGWYWCVVSQGACSSDPSIRVYVLMVGQQELQSGNFNIYPVPNDGKFTVSLVSPDEQIFTISIYSNLGILIREVKDVQVNGRYDQVVDLRPVANGLYTVVIANGANHVVKKVIVSK